MSQLLSVSRLEAVIDEDAPLGRPYERHEPTEVELTPGISRAWVEASRFKVPPSLGLALAAESHLALLDLRKAMGARERQAVAHLDDVAAGARVTPALNGPARDYLRLLLGRTVRRPEPVPRHTAVIHVPVRISCRVRRALPQALVATSVKRAISWEIAALAGERTIGEWAAWALLDLN